MIDKGVCNKGFIWNPSNCACESDKSCDVGAYLNYQNWRCRKRLADKLVEERTDNIDETEIAEIMLTENIHKCSSCVLYIVLFSIIFTTNIRVGTYFVYYKYMNLKKMFLYMIMSKSNKLLIYMGNIKEINIKSQTYYFFNDMINIEDFNSSLLKIV